MSAYAIMAGADPSSCLRVLIGRGLLDDQRAFSELDAMFRTTILDFLRKSCSDHCLADELTNKTFMRAYGSLPSFRGRGQRQFRSFLFTIASNLLKDHYRRAKQLPTTSLDAQTGNSANWGTDPRADAPLETKERAVMLRQALATLGPDQAELIRLSHLKGLKAEKIATMLGKPSGQAVRASLCRAMKDLKTALQRQGYFDQVSA